MRNVIVFPRQPTGVFQDGTDRGVSEAVSFVLVFSLVVTTVGVVYAVGYEGLRDARDVERVNNAERAFDVLANNVDDLVRRGAPSRATELRLADAGLRTGDPVYLNVTGDHESDASNFSTGELALAPVVYDADTGETLRYAGGAVLRTSGGGAAMVRDPSVVVDGDRLVVPVVQTSAGTGTSVGGSASVLVRTERTLTDVVVADPPGAYDEVRVELTTPHPEPWRRYFEAQGLTCPDAEQGPETVACTRSNVEHLYVVVVKIDVSFE